MTNTPLLLRGGSLSPAYCIIKTGKEAREKFLAGNDFVIHHYSGGSTYCSIRDFAPGCWVQLRYGTRLEKTTSIKVPKSKVEVGS